MFYSSEGITYMRNICKKYGMNEAILLVLNLNVAKTWELYDLRVEFECS